MLYLQAEKLTPFIRKIWKKYKITNLLMDAIL